MRLFKERRPDPGHRPETLLDSWTSKFTWCQLPSTRRAARAAQLERVRALMLEALGHEGPPFVARRIRFAADLVSLWYLRPDLLHALATQESESIARARLEEITAQFPDALPVLRPRISPLGA